MSDTRAIDSIRVPDWIREPAEQAWRETPVVARLFIGLALVDVLSRGLGVLQPRVDPGLDLFGIYAMLVPHDLWILLPAILVVRRPDAAKATPLVFWGAAVAAVTTLVERPLEAMLGGPYGATALSLEVGILAGMALVAAWILVARGLVALATAAPTPEVAGLSNLVLGLGLVGVFVELGRGLLSAPATGLPGIDGLLALGDLVAAGRAVAWLYLLWIVIRAVGDLRRPAVATMTAAIGAAMVGLLDAASSVLGAAIGALQSPLPYGGGTLSEMTYALALLSLGVGQALLVVGFALGLAEPPIPYEPPTTTEARDAAEPADAAEPVDATEGASAP